MASSSHPANELLFPDDERTQVDFNLATLGEVADEVLYTARPDVDVEQLDNKFIVRDPLKNSFIQLGVAEYIVFRCFDGKSSTHDIAQRLRVERNVIVTGAHVARLRDRLHEKQLV
ncbi:MAG TPA: hypothetical protein VIU61_18665, partial [Kofleriaceae bacterium]